MPESDMAGVAQGAGNNSSDFVSSFALYFSIRDRIVADGCMGILANVMRIGNQVRKLYK